MTGLTMFAGALLLVTGFACGYATRMFVPTGTRGEEKESPYDKYRDNQTGLYSRKAVRESKGR